MSMGKTLTGIAIASLVLLLSSLTATAAPLAIETALLTDGGVETPYTYSLVASGGTGSYTWKGSGILPPGLAVSADGILSGTPTSGGNYNFTVTATDGAAASVSKELFLNVTSHSLAMPALKPAKYSSCTNCHTSGAPNVAAPVATLLTTPPLASPSSSASFVFSASKSGCTFECSIDGEASVSCQSPLYYNSLANGFHTFRVRATDAIGTVQALPTSYTWNISALQIDTASLPAGTTGIPYNQTLTASGGYPSYYWYLSGTLPAGVGFSNGSFYGTPTQAGTFNISVYVEDDNMSMASRSYALDIASGAPAYINIPGLSDTYPTILNAYSKVPDSGTIKLVTRTFTEDLTFDRGITVNLKGGYDSGFNANAGSSKITGTLTVKSGTLIVDRIEIL